ncbi:hypothetical protein THASP1DRAFT_22427 [Thamnocephalis sphaerospora]|uniref:Uncharacterized protein n=1 Tax=Thamnocephalis sphaerospora TaxID=78915 RepID=A0A4P9XU99_9FUNG|nr:hypothetical protein THASP1DRAFT_22427 [Thamnocephalis sphaerospora]|eukprot:RKP09783.1 hypothetical protein THASP1DRAFT_22427 [Thamnocephalis sphaerospora]
MPLPTLASLMLVARPQNRISTPDIRAHSGPDGEVYAQLPPLARIFATPRWQLPASIRKSTPAKRQNGFVHRLLRRSPGGSTLADDHSSGNNGRLPATLAAAEAIDAAMLPSGSPGATRCARSQPSVLALYLQADDELRGLTDRFAVLPVESVRYLAPRAHILHQDHLRALHALSRLAVPRAQFGPLSYRLRIPIEDRHELERDGYCESVLFAARALARGYRIRGAERDTLELRELGIALYATYEAARVRIRCELGRADHDRVNALLSRYARLNAEQTDAISPETPEADEWSRPAEECPVYLRDAMLSDQDDADACALQGIRAVLIDFHRCWVAFERAVCRCYFCTEGHRPGCRHQDEIGSKAVQQWRDVLTAVVQDQLLDADLVAEVDPSVVLALPRLVLLDAVVRRLEMSSMTLPAPAKARSCPDLQAQPHVASATTPAASKATPGTLMQADPDTQLDEWWTGRADGLASLHTELRLMTSVQIRRLRRRLVLAATGEAVPDEADMLADQQLDSGFRTVCTIADALHSGNAARRYLTLLGRVLDNFSVAPLPLTPTTVESLSTATLREDNTATSTGRTGEQSGLIEDADMPDDGLIHQHTGDHSHDSIVMAAEQTEKPLTAACTNSNTTELASRRPSLAC